MRTSILYISYDGMTDALGRSQVVSYMKRLAVDHEVTILSYEKPSARAKWGTEVKLELDAAGVNWIDLDYTKRPPVLSTIKDVLKGKKIVRALLAAEKFDIVHCRGHIAGLIGMPALNSESKYVFDLRGWLPDEMKEAGRWAGFPYGLVFNFFKRMEKKMLTAADHVVSLTVRGKNHIVNEFKVAPDRIGVVPTCVDYDRFPAFDPAIRTAVRSDLGIKADAHVMLYSGSVGGNYPTRKIYDTFLVMKKLRPKSQLLILSKDGIEMAERSFTECKVPLDDMIISSCGVSDVHKFIMAADVGLILYANGFSTIGRSPTKLGEYWACGIPALVNLGIGDVGLVLADFPFGGREFDLEQGVSREAIRELLDARSENITTALRDASMSIFSIERGVNFYKSIYQKLKSRV